MKKQIVNLMYALTVVGSVFSFTSCDKKDDVIELRSQYAVLGEISKDTTWKAKDTVLLKGFVYVTEGTTLTIEPGTVIKGDKDTKGTLIIERGAKIMAQGTVAKPIVFTSAQPVGSRTYGDWGGVVICGKARINPAAGTAQIEGGPRSIYGGTVDTDNSGILKYVRIEYPGFPLEANKEINGLTLGAVGSGTTIENVQVSYSGDDSFEFFGGTVNCKNLIAYKGWDDDFDTDFGYSGKLQFLLGIRDKDHADTSGSNGFESDNDGSGSTNTPLTSAIFSNVTLIGPFSGGSAGLSQAVVLKKMDDASNGAKGGTFLSAMHLRRNTALKVYNSIFLGWPYGFRAKDATAPSGNITVKNVIIAGMWKNYYNQTSDSTFFNASGLGNKVFASTNDILTTNGNYSKVNTTNVAGADFSELDSWFTRTTNKGAFNGTDWTSGWANFDPQNTKY